MNMFFSFLIFTCLCFFSYCMDIEPRRHGEELIWTCKDCNGRISEPIKVQPRRSECIQEAAEIKLNQITMRKQTDSKSGHS